MNKDFDLSNDDNIDRINKEIENCLENGEKKDGIYIASVIDILNENYKDNLIRYYNAYKLRINENNGIILNLFSSKLCKILDNYIKLCEKSISASLTIFSKFVSRKKMDKSVQNLRSVIKEKILSSLNIMLEDHSYDLMMRLIEILPNDLFKNDPSIYYMTGTYLISGNFHEKALSKFRSAEIHEYSNKSGLYYNIGTCLLFKGEKLEALYYFRKLKNCKNVPSIFYYNIGLQFKKNDFYDNAFEFFKLFTEKDLEIGKNVTEREEAFISMADNCYRNEDFDSALDYCSKAQNISKSFYHYFNIGRCLMQKKDYTEAIKNFELSIQTDGSDLNLQYEQIAECNFYLNKYEQALYYYEKLKNDTNHIFNIGLCHYQLRRYEKASEYFQKVKNEHFDFYKSMLYMCICLIRCNDETKALQQLNFLEEHNFLNDQFYELVGQAFSENNQYNRAIEYFNKIKFKNPETLYSIDTCKLYMKTKDSIRNRDRNAIKEVIKDQLKLCVENKSKNYSFSNYIHIITKTMFSLEMHNEIIEILGSDSSIDDKELQYFIGISYLESSNKNDLKKAINYLEQSANQGYKKSQYELGLYYLNEEFNSKTAILFLKEARKQGYEPAKFMLELIKSKSNCSHEVLELQKAITKKLIAEHKEKSKKKSLQKANNYLNQDKIDQSYVSQGYTKFINSRNNSTIYVKLDLNSNEFKDLNQIEKNKFRTAFEKGIVGLDDQQGMKYIKEDGCKFLEIKIIGSGGDKRFYGQIKKDEKGIRYCEINQLKKTHKKDFVISK